MIREKRKSRNPAKYSRRCELSGKGVPNEYRSISSFEMMIGSILILFWENSFEFMNLSHSKYGDRYGLAAKQW